MGYELEGQLIVKNDTVVISERFKKREFIIQQTNTGAGDKVYIEQIKFQLLQNNCDALDAVNVGQDVTVHFNIKGKMWEKDGKINYFNNLDAWKIETNEMAQTSSGSVNQNDDLTQPLTPEAEADDLPF